VYVTVIVLVYCINNYSLTVQFEIPQYTTTFGDTVASTYTVTTYTSGFKENNIPNCAGPIDIGTSETISVTDTCTFQLLSIIYPDTPNARVFDSYALSEAVSSTSIYL
jgi:hypothetical protein